MNTTDLRAGCSMGYWGEYGIGGDEVVAGAARLTFDDAEDANSSHMDIFTAMDSCFDCCGDGTDHLVTKRRFAMIVVGDIQRFVNDFG